MENSTALPDSYITTSEPVEQDLNDILIQKISSNEELFKSIVREQSEPGVINLISPSWKNILDNNCVFLRHKEDKVKYSDPIKSPESSHLMKYSIIGQEDKLQLLLVGYFRVELSKSKEPYHTLTVDNCKPLDYVGKVMCQKQPNATYASNSKFFVTTCNGDCPNCRKYKLKYANVPKDNKWCLTSTKVFTSKGIELGTKEYCAAVFHRPTIAIVRLEINMKYFYNNGNSSKIGGVVKSVLFVQESLLRDDEDIKGILTLNDDASYVPESFLSNEQAAEDENLFAIPKGAVVKHEAEDEFQVESKKIKF